ncbi:hypothetical protein [Bartonella birtlesii]|uniref:Uncharacterized protein n=1 Tax=Bartonella birtlesii LL-WM9 TaxID=1094552 RepID=J1J3G7_9HYPH|nr:hypothetical protein [Bartonella birtlesii]EJF78215.1 hypothetical protein ME7_00206 [Bartonella birtlesii LL-WM9]
MLHSLFKFMAFIFVTLTIITFVIDSAHSISASHWMITPFNKILANLLQTDIYSLKQFISNNIPAFFSPFLITLTCLPVWSILGAVAIILCIFSHEQQKPFHKTSYT